MSAGPYHPRLQYGKDLSEGQWAIESIDLGEGDEKVLYRRVHLDAKQYGLSAEREQEFRQAGCWVDPLT